MLMRSKQTGRWPGLFLEIRIGQEVRSLKTSARLRSTFPRRPYFVPFAALAVVTDGMRPAGSGKFVAGLIFYSADPDCVGGAVIRRRSATGKPSTSGVSSASNATGDWHYAPR